MERKRSFNRSNIIYGIHAVEEALDVGDEVEKILIQKGIQKEGISQLLKIAKAKNIPVQFVPDEKLNRLAGSNHQGIACIMSLVPYYHVDDILAQAYEKGEMPLLIIADRITDVRNFGAIARTAYAAGAHAIIIPESETAAINSEAMKASAGALNKVSVCREKNLLQTLKQLKLNGIQTLAADSKGSKFIFECDLKIPTAMIIGSEGEGITHELLRIADEIIKVPMVNAFDSYNVSVATGMILYEVMRQRL